uniref:Uncharacterized protein n=1 Tax=Arundo donax TaxID=35708 RepID=A0A0A9G844_ARUDO
MDRSIPIPHPYDGRTPTAKWKNVSSFDFTHRIPPRPPPTCTPPDPTIALSPPQGAMGHRTLAPPPSAWSIRDGGAGTGACLYPQPVLLVRWSNPAAARWSRETTSSSKARGRQSSEDARSYLRTMLLVPGSGAVCRDRVSPGLSFVAVGPARARGEVHEGESRGTAAEIDV